MYYTQAQHRPRHNGNLDGPVFGSHSKIIGSSYSIPERERDQRTAAEAHGPEVDAATAWLQSLAEQRGVPLEPGFSD